MQIILEKKVIWNYFLITGDFYLKKDTKDRLLLLWLIIESCIVIVEGGLQFIFFTFDHIYDAVKKKSLYIHQFLNTDPNISSSFYRAKYDMQ